MEENDQAWRSLIVRDKDAGRRIDAYLAKRFASYSRSQIVRYIQEGLILSNQRALKPSSRILPNECLRLYVPGLVPDTLPPALPPILFEDEDLVVINKPSGMLVHPSGDTFVWAVIGLFKTAYPEYQWDLVHRIDRETSGALLLSKNKESNRFLKQRLAEREVYKTYWAIVRGVPEWDKMEIHGAIGIHPTSEIRLRRCVMEGGQPSHTTATVLQRLKEHSLVECKLHTGRTHQIRVHMDSVGFPLLGDKLYGQPDWVFLDYLHHDSTEEMQKAINFPRHCLHAETLHFPHPQGGYKKIRAPLPSEMQAVLDGEEPCWDMAGWNM